MRRLLSDFPRCHLLLGLVSLGWTLVCAAGEAPGPGATAVLRTRSLDAVIVDNGAYAPNHRAGYNGVSELRLAGDAQRSLFVPAYAGLNLEHFFSGDRESFGWDIFEPRRAPMRLVRRSSSRVELHQERSANWPIRSRLTYRAKGDAIDLEYAGTPLADAWSKHGYVGVFFASYIDAPEDLGIEFIGRSRPGKGDPTPRWIRHYSPSHGIQANHRPAGSSWDPPLDEGFPIQLARGASDVEYLYPFYFGRSGENVWIQMFERTGPEAELRFAQSPTGGGSGNPAWDFIYFRKSYAVNREFRFRVRTVYRKFESREAVIREYERWSGEKVPRGLGRRQGAQMNRGERIVFDAEPTA